MELISVGLPALLAAAVAGVTSLLAKSRAREAKRKRAKDLREVSFHVFGPIKVETATEPPGARESAAPEFLRDIERQIFARVESLPFPSQEAMRKEIEDQMAEVTQRIKKIEDRFPEEARIEKIASINDALLSERIDQLSKQIQGVESRILTKWDVALTVSAILTGIIVIVGATYAVLRAFGQAP